MNKTMKKASALLLSALMALSLAGCGRGASQSQAVAPESTASTPAAEPTAEPAESTAASDAASTDDAASTESESAGGSNILVAYFSLADEQYEVGVVEKGNTQFVAESIAEQTGADLFAIEPTEPYPTTYDGLLEISRAEENDPPEIAATVENWDDYDTIFIGYPIWWGALPTIVNEYLQSYDWNGKTVVPFCTHAGSGLSGTESAIASLCTGATVQDGLAVRGATAQNDRSATDTAVADWLGELGYAQ